MDAFIAEQDTYMGIVAMGLLKLILLALVIERALYFAFDVKFWRDRIKSWHRSLVAFAVSLLICWYHQFDLFYLITEHDVGATAVGIVLTALVVAGGSAAAVQLMQQVFGLSREVRDATKAEQRQRLARARADSPDDPAR